MLAEDGSVASPLGAALLGLGLISSSVGAVLIVALGGVLSTGLVGAFVITAGVLLVIAGIILMAVGGGRADRAMKMRAAP